MSFFNFSNYFFCLFSLYFTLFFYEPCWAGVRIDFTIEPVGQGNCATVKVTRPPKGKGPNQVDYMVIDVGSSAFGKEVKYKDRQEPIETPGKKKPKKKGASSSSSDQEAPPSVSRPEVHPSPAKPAEREEALASIIENIRKSLGSTTKHPSIIVKTVVITHPDKDHYGWLSKLFNNAKDKIENIILAGLPEHYNLKTRTWLDNIIEKGAHVFFPAIQYTPLNSMKEVMPTERKKKLEEAIREESKDKKKEKTKRKPKGEEARGELPFEEYAEHAYMTPNGEILTDSKKVIDGPFKEAFDFGEDVKVCPLSINPLHNRGVSGRIVRLSDGKEDDNKESLTLKIHYTNVLSAIFMGDATEATTNRIVDNYYFDKDFLKADFLLSSHHGASTHGSNNTEWLEIVQPGYIFVSNGLFYGHPSPDAYKAFHISSLKQVKNRHGILVGKEKIQEREGSKKKKKKKDKGYSRGILNKTNAAIFSTLNSGKIEVNQVEERVSIKTDQEGVIKEIPSKKKKVKKDTKKEYDVSEDEGEIVLTPSPKKVSKSTTIKKKPTLRKQLRERSPPRKLALPSSSEDKSSSEESKSKKKKGPELEEWSSSSSTN